MAGGDTEVEVDATATEEKVASFPCRHGVCQASSSLEVVSGDGGNEKTGEAERRVGSLGKRRRVQLSPSTRDEVDGGNHEREAKGLKNGM